MPAGNQLNCCFAERASCRLRGTVVHAGLAATYPVTRARVVSEPASQYAIPTARPRVAGSLSMVSMAWATSAREIV